MSVEITITVIVAVIIAFNEFLKKNGVRKPIIPYVSIVLGVVCSYFFLSFETLQITIFVGIVIGLSSNGLFDLTKISEFIRNK